jgi:hypothetical protein
MRRNYDFLRIEQALQRCVAREHWGRISEWSGFEIGESRIFPHQERTRIYQATSRQKLNAGRLFAVRTINQGVKVTRLG